MLFEGQPRFPGSLSVKYFCTMKCYGQVSIVLMGGPSVILRGALSLAIRPVTSDPACSLVLLWADLLTSSGLCSASLGLFHHG